MFFQIRQLYITVCVGDLNFKVEQQHRPQQQDAGQQHLVGIGGPLYISGSDFDYIGQFSRLRFRYLLYPLTGSVFVTTGWTWPYVWLGNVNKGLNFKVKG